MHYYDAKKNWRKIKRHLNDDEANRVLVEDFNKFTYGRWHKPFVRGDLPEQFESCDWRWGHGRRGRQPAYWRYVKHAACHWLVNFNLRLAMLVEPDRVWRILTSKQHSTVWDGELMLFDFNFQALGITPDDSFEMANKRELKPGKYLVTHIVPSYRDEKEYRDWAARHTIGDTKSPALT
jgi:hypothetical protein